MSNPSLPATVQPSLPMSADEAEWARLESIADTVAGARLIKEKSRLIGLPHIIVSVTVRDGIPHGDKKNPIPSNYVSCEAIVGAKATLDRAVKLGTLGQGERDLFDPLERIVYNDGSTGICRQVVSYLEAKGFVVMPNPDGPTGGGMGESRFDAHFTSWAYPVDSVMHVKVEEDSATFLDVVLRVPRGLRQSLYESDFNPEGGATFYFG